MKMLICSGALLAGMALGAAAHGAEPQSPQAFMERLYQRFETGPDAAKADWARGEAGEAFDPPLAHLIRKYTAAADRHQNAGLDYVPFCGCNDDGGLKYAIAAHPTTAGKATAAVTVSSTNPGAPRPFVLTYDLVTTPTGWRVADIHSRTTPSLKRQVAENLRTEYHLSAP